MQEIELQIIYFVQSFSTQFLDNFFEIATMIGEETFYVVVFSFLYWCYDKKLGRELTLTFLLGSCVNTGLKELFHMPRPIGEKGVRTLREHTATGYSFPSGHTQGTTTFFYFMVQYLKKTWFTILSSVLIFLVALSRIYLGVHWPKDVIAAIVISIIIVHFGRKFFKELSLIKTVVTVAIVNGLLIFFSSKGYVTSAAVFTGGMIGLFLEGEFINYEIKKGFKNNLIKFVIGILDVLAIKEGFKIVLPSGMIFNYIRYWLVGIWVSLGAMVMFKKLKL